MSDEEKIKGSYFSKPRPQRARQVWDFFTQRHGEPQELWFNPNCWGSISPLGIGNLWGFWVARIKDQVIYYLPREILKPTTAAGRGISK